MYTFLQFYEHTSTSYFYVKTFKVMNTDLHRKYLKFMTIKFNCICFIFYCYDVLTVLSF